MRSFYFYLLYGNIINNTNGNMKASKFYQKIKFLVFALAPLLIQLSICTLSKSQQKGEQQINTAEERISELE